MTPFVNPQIVKDAVEKDLERAITRGERERERVLEICTNPKCFDDTCKGECECCAVEECKCGKDK